MKKPTLEEVKEYFKNAEKCISSLGSDFIMSDYDLNGIYEENGAACIDRKDGTERTKHLYDFDDHRWAEILTRKEKTFSITAEQLRQLTDPKLKEWFPEVFEVKLEVGKWYKSIGIKSGCMGFDGIGIFTDEEIESGWDLDCDTKSIALKQVNGRVWGVLADRFKEATEQEVFEALKNEAIKRGFVEGSYIKDLLGNNMGTGKNNYDRRQVSNEKFDFDIRSNYLFIGNLMIFQKGKWATIIPTCTREEAEKLLNKKIID